MSGEADPDHRPNHVLEIDAAGKKSLAELFKDDLPNPLWAASGDWAVDQLIARIPWITPTSHDEGLTFCRLAVQSAWGSARDAQGALRGKREAMAIVRAGNRWLGGASPADRADDPADMLGEMVSSMYARTLGVDWKRDGGNGERLRSAARGRPGDRGRSDVEVFVQTLAAWWWRNTGRIPERRRRQAERLDNRRKSKSLSFLEFLEAAFVDAVGRPNFGLARRAGDAIRDLEKAGRAPWKFNSRTPNKL